MNRLWKKRVPAFFLTLVMIVSLMPAALADDPPVCGVHNVGDPLSATLTAEETVSPTCGKPGERVWNCSLCKWHQTETIPATGRHDLSDWERVNDEKHTRKCLNAGCGYEEPPVSHDWWPASPVGSAGESVYHTMTCKDCGVTVQQTHAHDDSIGRRDLTCEVNAATYYTCSVCRIEYYMMEGPMAHTLPNADKKCDRCKQPIVTGNTIKFETNGSTNNSPAALTQTVPTGSTLSVSIRDPEKGAGYKFIGWQEGSSSNYLYTGQTTLKTSADLNPPHPYPASTTFYAIYQVNITEQAGYVSAASNIGEKLWNHIKGKCVTYLGGAPATVTLTVPTANTSGTLYLSGVQSAENAVQSNYPYDESRFWDMTYQPGSSTAPYRLRYTAKDSSGKNSVSGYVDINRATAGTITISVTPGGKDVYFDSTQFQNAYRAAGFTDTLSYVMFPNVPGSYTDFSAKVYNGTTELNANTWTAGKYYYPAGINALLLRAPSNAKADAFSTTYRVYSSTGAYADGTLELKVSSAASGDINYSVVPGKSVNFSANDFRTYLRKTYTSDQLAYVLFSNTTISNGTLYHKYNKSGEVSFTGSRLSRETFYYSPGSLDYGVGDLTFVASSSFKGDLTIGFTAYSASGSNRYVTGNVVISAASGTKGDINYDVAPGKSVDFDSRDFRYFYEDNSSGTFSYVEFAQPASSAFSNGTLYYNYGATNSKTFTRTTIGSYKFYRSPGSNDYGLDSLTFVAGTGFKDTITLDFTAYGTGSSVRGTLAIASTESGDDGDVTYSVVPGKSVDLRRTDFNVFFRKTYSSTVSYVTFDRPSSSAIFNNGTLYCDYGTNSQTSFTYNTLSGNKFYYNKSDVGSRDYYLDELTFVAGTGFKDSITLNFTAYGTGASEYVEGTLVIKADGTAAITSNYTGGIRYSTTTGTNVQINANDIARYFRKNYPAYNLQYVILNGAPATGGLYYNYYNASSYGTTARTQITAANCTGMMFYLSPTSTTQYALTELTYVPSGTGYCAGIPFTAYGSAGSVTGSILISVSRAAVAEVYGVTPRNTAVSFPASSIYSAVLTATGTALSGIQLLELPAVTTGTVYIGTGNDLANTRTMYTYAAGTNQMSLLRFVPTAAYTGSVEIPYVALDASGNALAIGTFALGVLNNRKTLSDVNASTWCYKYVMELTDQNVISGYSDGSFKPNSTVTYGAALKLIMLAAGYPEQAPTGKNVFSGYLTKAQADGIITRSNVNLTAPITRLQVAQLAAGALKLSTSNLSSVKPFTDTSDVYVQALNAAGIVEGYFSNGTSTYRPSNTLTRGQMSAIVWRMMQYRK